MVESSKNGEMLAKPKEQGLIVTNIEESQYDSGIPLRGWDSVGNALNIFSSGAPKGSRATEQHQMKAVGESYGGFAATFYSIAAPHMKGGSSFVERMLEEAKQSIDSRGRWSRSYDYDGQGSFFKTTVNIRKAGKKDDYILSLNAAYVGNQVEEGLAEHLSVDRGISWKNVTVELQPEGDQFKVDFDQVAEKLQPVISVLTPTKKRKKGAKVTGEDIVNQLMKTDRFGDSSDPYLLGTKNGLEVTVGLGRVGRRYEWVDGEKSEDKFKIEGTVLSGPLDTDYRDETKFVNPSISISIKPEGEKYDRLPVVDPNQKVVMSDLQSRVAQAFK